MSKAAALITVCDHFTPGFSKIGLSACTFRLNTAGQLFRVTHNRKMLHMLRHDIPATTLYRKLLLYARTEDQA